MMKLKNKNIKSVAKTDGVENQVVPLITKQSFRSSILDNLSSAKPTIYKNYFLT
jgi:cyanate lyase